MANEKKLNEVRQIYLETLKKIASSIEKWNAYLESASRFYRYSFQDSVLLYAYKPEASAAASFQIWTEKMGRRIKRGAKGVPLLSDQNGKERLRYVFTDDCTEISEASKELRLWKYDPEKTEYILRSFQANDNETDMSKWLNKLAEKRCPYTESDEIFNRLEKEGIISEDIPGMAPAYISYFYYKSVAYSLHCRVGVPYLYSDNTKIMEASLQICSEYPAILNEIGGLIQQRAGEILHQIGQAVFRCEHEKEMEKIFADHSVDKNTANTYNINRTDVLKGGIDHEANNSRGAGTDLSRGNAARRDASTDSGPHITGSAGPLRGNHILGRGTEGISERKPSGTLLRHDNGKYSELPSGNGTEAGREIQAAADRIDGEAGRADGGLQKPESIGVGQKDDGDHGDSKERNISRDHLQIKKTENSIMETIEGAEKETAPFLTEKRKPEAPKIQPVNYRITDMNPDYGSPKNRFRQNIQAIKTLFMIEREGRSASLEEQEILSCYVGWGGLSQAFDPDNVYWQKEYGELKEILSDTEYRDARESTMTSFYTDPKIIRAMYTALAHMGFQGGRILEPSCGVGAFFGMLPENMGSSSLYGVELDSISGRIARLLYPSAQITIDGFEKTDFHNTFDVAIGNVPFGNYTVFDKAFSKENFQIHNYFFAKALEAVRPGGIIAFITSRYLMDAASSKVRSYLAERAELLGAVRLPSSAFKKNAGTETVADIVFLQKKVYPKVTKEAWIYLGRREDGIAVNSYFVEHPEQVLGKMYLASGQYGRPELRVLENKEDLFEEKLNLALEHIRGTYQHQPAVVREQKENVEDMDEGETVPANPDFRKYSYSVDQDGKLWYRHYETMKQILPVDKNFDRTKAMAQMAACVRSLLDQEVNGDLLGAEESRKQLNHLYDNFLQRFGNISSQANKKAFADDSSYCLLSALEKYEKGKYAGKADIFTKETVRPRESVMYAASPQDALTVSIREKGGVDLDYMSLLLNGMEKTQLVKELKGQIFKNPDKASGRDPFTGYESADEYLSGNIVKKLAVAKTAAEMDPSYTDNIGALENARPKLLTADEIDVRLGATWISAEYVNQFIKEVFHADKSRNEVEYSKFTGEWKVNNKNWTAGNILLTDTYGTHRINALEILECTLNLKSIQITDTEIDINGRERKVVNPRETVLANQKQEIIKEKFKEWIFASFDRRTALVKEYNEKFNCIRPRTFDGGYLNFPGSNPEIDLRAHQKNAVARILSGKNTLLAHVVGAGKTYTMAAAIMESKRLGLVKKPMMVVPKHLVLQEAADFMKLYPRANILVTTKADFEPSNRKKFCTKIALGEWDAVIIGQTQFEKIPLSAEYQEEIINGELDELDEFIREAKREKRDSGKNFTVKQAEKTKRRLKQRLEKLSDSEAKDDVITFEELGIDALYCDEAHYYKNLYIYTKMSNVAGIGQSEAQKSMDLLAKIRYINERAGGNVVFATGTPVSNTMTEMFVMQKYLQSDLLADMQLQHFDSWASTFGEVTNEMELALESNRYHAKNRFSNFYNLPELLNIFRETADIQTADMLHLDVPETINHDIVTKPSIWQKEGIKSLGERADRVRAGAVDPSEDNMLKITSDGRKLALDQRLYNSLAADDPNGKVSRCAEEVAHIWKETMDQKSTQLIFCDLSTPRSDGEFDVYHDLKAKLMELGIPNKEIAFIHDAKTDAAKEKLFDQVRNGVIRILIGSTQKMGAGTNVQDKLAALHHLDVPWRPADFEQRNGRGIRQGNENSQVAIYRYITEGTFDAYSWQLIEKKQKFISQIMSSKSPVRSCDDIDEAVLSAAEAKMLATGDPRIKEKMDLDVKVQRLKIAQAAYKNSIFHLEDCIKRKYPLQIQTLQDSISRMEKDVKRLAENEQTEFEIMIGGVMCKEKASAGKRLEDAVKEHISEAGANGGVEGSYRGFPFYVYSEIGMDTGRAIINGAERYEVSAHNMKALLTNILLELEAIPNYLEVKRENLQQAKDNLSVAEKQVKQPFAQEGELKKSLARLTELNLILEESASGNSTGNALSEIQPVSEKAGSKERREYANRR